MNLNIKLYHYQREIMIYTLFLYLYKWIEDYYIGLEPLEELEKGYIKDFLDAV